MPEPRDPAFHKLDNQSYLMDVSDPNEKTADGRPISRAIIIKSAKRKKGDTFTLSDIARKSLTSQVKIKPDEAKELYKNETLVEPVISINALSAFAQTCSIHSIALQRKARVIAGLGIKSITKESERELRQLVRKARRKRAGDPALANWNVEGEWEDWEDPEGTDAPDDEDGDDDAAQGNRFARLRNGANGNSKFKPKPEAPKSKPNRFPNLKKAFDGFGGGGGSPFGNGANGNGNGNGYQEDSFGLEVQTDEMVKQKAKQAKQEKLLDEKVREALEKLEKIDKEKKALDEWVETAGDDIPLREVLERCWYDFESLGWFACEVVRTANGRPATLVHLPAHLIRRAKDRQRFVYLKSPTQKVWFKAFGSEIHLNVRTGAVQMSDDGKTPSDKPWDEHLEANEIIFWYQYNSLDPFYGVPGWYAALPEILGSNEARDFMLFYFTRRATPTYALTIEGGSWSPATLSAIKNFFRRDLTGDHHATLLLETPKDGKITFQRMTDEPRWVVLVQQYLASLRDAIVSAHGLSPALVGVIENASLGSGTGDSQMQIFKAVEARPKQETLEGILNNMIVRKGLKLETQKLKLDELDVFDETTEVAAVNTLYAAPPRPTITLNEARKRLRYDPIEEEWADEILVQGTGGLTPLSHLEVPQAGQPQNPMGGAPPFGGGGDLSGMFGGQQGQPFGGAGGNGNAQVGVGGNAPSFQGN